MAMGMRRHVDRHAVHKRGEVGAVVEVEAAQKVLVGFAITTVLGDDDARHKLQHLGRAQRGAVFNQLGSDHALAGGVGGSDCVVIGAFDLYRRKLVSGCCSRVGGCLRDGRGHG